MEHKKSREADLETKKIGFFFMGLVMISALVLMGFEYTNAVADEKTTVVEDDTMEEELVFEIPPEEEIPEEEPEVAPPPPVLEEIEVVEDEEEVPELDLTSMEDEIDEVPDEVEEGPVEEPILDFVEVEPSFPGGAGAMTEWITNEVDYPELAREMGEQGIVYVKFVVNKDGSIQDVSIRKGVSDALDAEAKRVVKKMPRWTPGEQAGKPVRVNFTLPIHFRLG